MLKLLLFTVLLYSIGTCAYRLKHEILYLSKENYDEVYKSDEPWLILFTHDAQRKRINRIADAANVGVIMQTGFRTAVVDCDSDENDAWCHVDWKVPLNKEAVSILIRKRTYSLRLHGDEQASIASVQKFVAQHVRHARRAKEQQAEEERKLDAVVELGDATFDEALAKSDVFALFFAPWCGHCKAMKPEWSKFAAEAVADKAPYVVASVDCTSERDLCARYAVSSYPTVIYQHSGGGRAREYVGARVAGQMKAFAADASAGETVAVRPEEARGVQWDDKQVLKLSTAQLSTLGRAWDVFVRFEAPWCEVCRDIDEAWLSLPGEIDDEKRRALLVADVNCHDEANSAFCKSVPIDGYPTLVYATANSAWYEDIGPQSLKGLLSFLMAPLQTGKLLDFSLPPLSSADAPLTSIDSNEALRELRRDKNLFILFMRESCPHCALFKPVYTQLTKIVADTMEGAAAIMIDCTKLGRTCAAFRVDGVPTLVYVPRGADEFYVHGGARHLRDVTRFAVFPEHGARLSVDASAFGADEVAGSAEEEDTDRPTNVLQLEASNFDAEAVSGTPFLVEFYAPWCGHCKKLSPEWDAASMELAEKGSAMRLAKVDCVDQGYLCGSQFRVRSYPTIVYTPGNGVFYEWTGQRNKEAVVEFADKRDELVDEMSERHRQTPLLGVEEVDKFLIMLAQDFEMLQAEKKGVLGVTFGAGCLLGAIVVSLLRALFAGGGAASKTKAKSALPTPPKRGGGRGKTTKRD